MRKHKLRRREQQNRQARRRFSAESITAIVGSRCVLDPLTAYTMSRRDNPMLDAMYCSIRCTTVACVTLRCASVLDGVFMRNPAFVNHIMRLAPRVRPGKHTETTRQLQRRENSKLTKMPHPVEAKPKASTCASSVKHICIGRVFRPDSHNGDMYNTLELYVTHWPRQHGKLPVKSSTMGPLEK